MQQLSMLKSFSSVTITISMIFIFILCTLFPTLAHGQQHQQFFPFLPPTNTIKDQINNDILNESTTTVSSVNSDPSSADKAVILDFYDNDIGQFTYAKPILDKYGFAIGLVQTIQNV